MVSATRANVSGLAFITGGTALGLVTFIKSTYPAVPPVTLAPSPSGRNAKMNVFGMVLVTSPGRFLLGTCNQGKRFWFSFHNQGHRSWVRDVYG